MAEKWVKNVDVCWGPGFLLFGDVIPLTMLQAYPIVFMVGKRW